MTTNIFPFLIEWTQLFFNENQYCGGEIGFNSYKVYFRGNIPEFGCLLIQLNQWAIGPMNWKHAWIPAQLLLLSHILLLSDCWFCSPSDIRPSFFFSRLNGFLQKREKALFLLKFKHVFMIVIKQIIHKFYINDF